MFIYREYWSYLYLSVSISAPDTTATVHHCARELRQIGDGLYWRYKLLEMLLKNYKTVANIKWADMTSKFSKRKFIFCKSGWYSKSKQKNLGLGFGAGAKMEALKWDVTLWRPGWRCSMRLSSHSESEMQKPQRRPHVWGAVDSRIQSHERLEEKSEKEVVWITYSVYTAVYVHMDVVLCKSVTICQMETWVNSWIYSRVANKMYILLTHSTILEWCVIQLMNVNSNVMVVACKEKKKLATLGKKQDWD